MTPSGSGGRNNPSDAPLFLFNERNLRNAEDTGEDISIPVHAPGWAR